MKLDAILETSSTVRRCNSTSVQEIARSQRLLPTPSWLTSRRTSGHQKLVPTFPWMDNCLMATKTLTVGCLPYAVGKQPSIPLINLGRTWTLKWWWCCERISNYRIGQVRVFIIWLSECMNVLASGTYDRCRSIWEQRGSRSSCSRNIVSHHRLPTVRMQPSRQMSCPANESNIVWTILLLKVWWFLQMDPASLILSCNISDDSHKTWHSKLKK